MTNSENYSEKRRDELLFRMYDQLWNSINSHLLVVWQSLGLVIGAFALLALVEKEVIPIDWAVSLIVILGGWLIANLIDASYWYNRNLVIIANIEREFLREGDDKNISNYFLKHREQNKMITHFQIQVILGILIVVVILIYHFLKRIIPSISNNYCSFELVLPYITLITQVIYLIFLDFNRKLSYQDVINKSPGKPL